MIRLTRIEFLKLRTMRTTYGLLLAAVAITGLFASLEASRSGRRVAPISTADGPASVTTATGVAMVLALVLGVIAASGEYRHGNATLTFLATPRRSRVLAARTAAATIVGAGYGVAAGVGLVFVASDGDDVTLGTATMIGHLVGAGIGAGLLAALGVAVGTLLRSQLAGVIGVLVWCLVVESILGGTVSAIRPYLPYTAASTLGGAKLGAAAFGPGYSVSDQSALPFVAAAALLIAIGLACSAVAARTSLAADIT
jgi:ABC-type transport system involved in multi-copper enzyme maturation permease subunit